MIRFRYTGGHKERWFVESTDGWKLKEICLNCGMLKRLQVKTHLCTDCNKVEETDLREEK